jgi:hypothetical protein
MDNTEATRYSNLTKRRYGAEKNAKNKCVAPAMHTNKTLSNFNSLTSIASFFLLYLGIHFKPRCRSPGKIRHGRSVSGDSLERPFAAQQSRLPQSRAGL